MNELMSKFFSLKSFGFKDYMQHLIAAIYTLAETGPAIFVGRGAHLIIPREYVLGIRLIASMHYRIKCVAHLYSLGEDLAEEKLKQMDREHKDFFRKAFRKTVPSPSDFDLVINLDHFHGHQEVASVIENAFRQKFGV
jgi:cytidylate kinase